MKTLQHNHWLTDFREKLSSEADYALQRNVSAILPTKEPANCLGAYRGNRGEEQERQVEELKIFVLLYTICPLNFILLLTKEKTKA